MSNVQDGISWAIQTAQILPKYSTAHRIFILFSVFGYTDETLSLVFDILYQLVHNCIFTNSRDICLGI